jgi:hypothetical protein
MKDMPRHSADGAARMSWQILGVCAQLLLRHDTDVNHSLNLPLAPAALVALSQVLCVAAQVVLVRRSLLASSTPKSILDYRVWPPLQSALTISVAMSFLPHLSPKLYAQITQHATNTKVAEEISATHMHENTKGLQLTLAHPNMQHNAEE